MDLVSLGIAPLAFIVTTIAIGAFIKGVTGLGLPVFAIPALVLFIPIEQAVVIMALPGLIANGWLIAVHRQHFPLLRKHRPFLIAGIIGAVAGTWALIELSDAILRIVLTVWLGAYLIQHFFFRDRTPLGSGGVMAGPLGLVAGTLQGATGISAPIIGPYFHVRNLAPASYAFIVAFTFALLSVGQLSTMVSTNLITPALFGYSLLATATTMMFIPIGVRYSNRLTRQSFDRFLIVIFVLLEAKLIYDVFT